MENDKPSTASLTRISNLPRNRQNSLSEATGSGSIIHRVENVTASIKFTGHIVTGLSDSEQEFTSSGEETDYTLREISTADFEPKELVFSEDIEHLSNTIEKTNSKSNSPLDKETKSNSLKGDLSKQSKEKQSSYQETIQNKFKQTRFNPFDRDLHMDEDHFDNDDFSDIDVIRSHSASNASSSWTNVTDGGDDITYADLGLAEDHFSLPDGHFGVSSTEEIEMAIENCKEMIREAQPNTDKAKNLVQKLIQLRLRLQNIKEGPEPVDKGVKVVVGHKFQLEVTRSTKHYCEKCNAMILGVIQSWFRCSELHPLADMCSTLKPLMDQNCNHFECGYCCHEKCLNLITRTCASLKVQENPTFCLSICPNRGLSSQNYRCAECRSPISFKSGFSEPRLCDYSGNYYCELCHWNDTMIMPARVLHNWDFEPRKVCRASKQFLKLMTNKAVIRIQDINPMLFNFVEELNEVKKLREELLIMKKYLLICSDAMDSKFLLLLKNRQHFVESSDNYSMRDLLDIQSDVLLGELVQVHSTWAQHIKTDCQRCQAKGFICELCNEKEEILFPFDNIAVVCSQCSVVLHRHCFAKKGAECPRCARRNKRKAN